MPTLVIVPGFNEPSRDLKFMIDGRHGIPGFAARGFDCCFFDHHDDDLGDRIDRYREFILALLAEGREFPVVSWGYSAGGVLVRALLRRYPEMTELISHTIQVGALNWGIAADLLPQLAMLLRISDRAMPELDIHGDFMRWLNGTGGHWAWRKGEREKFWELDAPPIIGPPNAKILSIFGQVPKFGDDNDGIVWVDSATLGGAMTAQAIRSDDANHLNLVGLFQLAVRIFKGFIANDNIWPQVIDATVRYVETGAAGPNLESALAEHPLHPEDPPR